MKRRLAGNTQNGAVRSTRTGEWVAVDPDEGLVTGVTIWAEDGGIGDFLDPDTPETRSDYLERLNAALSNYFPHAEVDVRIVPDKNGRTEFAWYEVDVDPYTGSHSAVYHCWTEPGDEEGTDGDHNALYDIVSGITADVLRATNRAAADADDTPVGYYVSESDTLHCVRCATYETHGIDRAVYRCDVDGLYDGCDRCGARLGV